MLPALVRRLCEGERPSAARARKRGHHFSVSSCRQSENGHIDAPATVWRCSVNSDPTAHGERAVFVAEGSGSRLEAVRSRHSGGSERAGANSVRDAIAAAAAGAEPGRPWPWMDRRSAENLQFDHAGAFQTAIPNLSRDRPWECWRRATSWIERHHERLTQGSTG